MNARDYTDYKIRCILDDYNVRYDIEVIDAMLELLKDENFMEDLNKLSID